MWINTPMLQARAQFHRAIATGISILAVPARSRGAMGTSQTCPQNQPKSAEDLRPTIFIVDDDEAVRTALRMLVLSFGWNAVVYASGQVFLDAVAALHPDCVLLDLNMPGMNGAEVQEALLARGIEVPVIAITGHKDPHLVARVRAAGACDLLNKPFDDVELKLAVERALGL
jgi:FixJ family two-component response regulator